jgi:hypothetical protein
MVASARFSSIAVSHTLAKLSNIMSENTIFERLWLSPLTRISIDVADNSLLPLLFLRSLSILLTYVVATKIWSYHELDPWHIIHILGLITANFLLICLIVMAGLAIFQARMWVVIVTCKLLIDLGVRNFSNTTVTWPGNMLVSGWLSVLLHYRNRLNVVMDWKVHIEKLELNDTQNFFSVMNVI